MNDLTIKKKEPFLFIEKKNHWLILQAEREFAVMKLDGSNYSAIIAEVETKGVKVKKVKKEEREKDKK